MKKSLVIGILGLAVGAVSSYGQGNIFLDNYLSSTYNGIFEAVILGGGLVPTSFTAGIYYDTTANANITASVAADPTGTALPGSLNPSLVLATGPGSTAPFVVPGYFSAGPAFNIQPGSLTPAQGSYTLMIVAYNGSSYATSTIRGHSAAVYVLDAAPDIAYGGDLGTFFATGVPMFSVASVPEPTTLALGALGGLGLLLFRRKQA
jgi:hypothetical protein